MTSAFLGPKKPCGFVIGLMMRMDTKSIQVPLVQFPVKPLEVISGPVFHVKIIKL